MPDQDIEAISKMNASRMCADISLDDQASYFHWQLDRQLSSAALGWHEGRSIDYVNVQSVIESEKPSDWKSLFYDYVHLNADGQYIVARHFADKIIATDAKQ